VPYHRFALAFALAAALSISIVAVPRDALAQATCVDTTGDACLNVIRTARVDGVVNDIFSTRDGLLAPQLSYARLVRGINGCFGRTDTPTILTGYRCSATGVPELGTDPRPYADSLDWNWTQVIRTYASGAAVPDGAGGEYEPTRGRIYDLGGEANRVVLFPITDHPPLPCEAFEYSVWLSNDPMATRTATPDAPDPLAWNPARLIRTFTQGWTRNPFAAGVSEAGRPDLGTYLRDTTGGDAVADALATVWALPCGLSFRYVSIQAGNYGNPGPECVYHSSDDELDAVAGLNEDDTAICIDADGDGHRAASCGGGDCDDTDPSVHPGAFEPCDSPRDLDCQPPIVCPTGTSCDASSGLCVSVCFEGGCATGFTCTPGNLCVEEACASRTEPCPAGTLCRGGECRAPCDGVFCPRGQLCAGGACIDPCAGVVCPAMQVCIAGEPGAVTVCGPACTCTEVSVPLCPAGRACDARDGSPTAGHCVDPGCDTLECMAGEICTTSGCVDACTGVVCPLGQLCRAGECVPDACASITCPGAQICRDGVCHDPCDFVTCGPGEICNGGVCAPDPCAAIMCGDGFTCVGGSCVPTGPRDAGSTMGDIDAGRRPREMTGGCCRIAGGPQGGGSAATLSMLALALLALRRRR
jgi:hypothetical protein